MNRMITLHDSLGSDLTRVKCFAEKMGGFRQNDYVRIVQPDGQKWIGQIVEANCNVPILGIDFLHPTILQGLVLAQTDANISTISAVHVFEVAILGQSDGDQLTMPWIRPLQGSRVEQLESETIRRFLALPRQDTHADGSINVIGVLPNVSDAPLCITPFIFNHHIMVAGGSGSGKSNVGGNLVMQAQKYGYCVILHDPKPDYALMAGENTDPLVQHVWPRFTPYGLRPAGAQHVRRIGFYGQCDPDGVDCVVGISACDLDPEMLAGVFFSAASSTADQNAFDAFSTVASALRTKMYDQPRDRRQPFTLDDIINEIKRRDRDAKPDMDPSDTIHHLTVVNICNKVKNRRRGMRWLDAVGTTIGPKGTQRDEAFRSSLDGDRQLRRVVPFSLDRFAAPGAVIVVDYGDMEDAHYALILSYFLGEGQRYRKKVGAMGPRLIHLVDEAHRVFDNESRHSSTLKSRFSRVMREGRSRDHTLILVLQNASQIPSLVANNLGTRIVLTQNSKREAEAATETFDKKYVDMSMQLGQGQAFVKMFEAPFVVSAHMAPSPFELMRPDNAGAVRRPVPQMEEEEDDNGM